MIQITGWSAGVRVLHARDETITVGNADPFTPPDSSPESHCCHAQTHLLASDPLCLHRYGRVALADGDNDEIYYTLALRLETLPDTMTVPAVRAYGGERAALAHVCPSTVSLQIPNLETSRHHQ